MSRPSLNRPPPWTRREVLLGSAGLLACRSPEPEPVPLVEAPPRPPPSITVAAIPAGALLLGRPSLPDPASLDATVYWEDEQPARVIAVSAFHMAVHPVTQGTWEAVVRANPSYFHGRHLEGDTSPHPVENVSWEEAALFCNALSRLEGRSPVYRFDPGLDDGSWTWDRAARGWRLPTEAEWEFACRAGTATAFWSGDAEADLARVGWYAANGQDRTWPVGLLPANPWGLHDLHGNVEEWCWDVWDPASVRLSAEVSDTAPREAAHVRRGGCFASGPLACRSAFRIGDPARQPLRTVGLRVVIDAGPT